MEKYITHENHEGEIDLKLTRIEILDPHIDHNNSYNNLRKIGLPFKIMSTLFKLKNDLFLTEERKFHCSISNSNRCIHCQKVVFMGNLLLCTKHNLQKICSKLVEKCIQLDKNISAERIPHLDIQGTFEEKFATG